MQATGRFRRSDRLLKSRDFRRVSRCGRRGASAYFVLLSAGSSRENGPGGTSVRRVAQSRRPRLGITVSRKVGNAVVRNRLKRGIREWFRDERRRFEVGTDLVVIARRGAGQLGSRSMAAELTSLWERGRGH